MMLKPYPLIAALVFSSILIAEPHSEHGQRDKHSTRAQQAHEHGTAQLTLAQEGNIVEISFQSPAANIVGFEHKASSKQQVEALEEARKSLETPGLFLFPGSDCSLKRAEVDMSSVSEQGHQHSDYHDHEGHSEISANYSYECSKGDELKTVLVNLMSPFPAIETLEVMWLTNRQQGATKLKATSNIIRMR